MEANKEAPPRSLEQVSGLVSCDEAAWAAVVYHAFRSGRWNVFPMLTARGVAG